MAVPVLVGTPTQTVVTSTGGTLSYTVPAGNNRGLVVELIIRNGPVTVNSVKYGGVDLIKAVTFESPTDTLQTEIWYLPDPAVGTANVVVSLGSSENHRIIAESFTADGPFTLGVTNTGSGATDPSVAVTTLVPDSIVVDSMISEAVGPEVVGAGQTAIFTTSEVSWSDGASTEPASTPSTVTMSWTGTDDQWVSVVASFHGAAGGGFPAYQRFVPATLRRFRQQPFSRLGFPLPDFSAPVADVSVPVTAALATGSSPAPVVKLDAPTTAALALGVTPAPVVDVKVLPAAALAVASSPAPGPVVVIPLTAALALGVTPAPTVIVAGNVTVVVGAATALGVVPAPVILVTVPQTAALALGVVPAPTVLLVKAVTAALALGVSPAAVPVLVKIFTAALANASAPAPTVIIAGGNVTIPVTAALALASTMAPVVIVGAIPFLPPFDSNERGVVGVTVGGRVGSATSSGEITTVVRGRMGSA